MSDNDLLSAFNLAVADEPPCERGPEQVFLQAGRIRTRQRLAVTVGGAASVVVVLGLVLAAGAYGLPGRGGSASLSVGAPAGQPSSKPSPSPTPSIHAEKMIPPAEMLAILKSLLPPGDTTSEDVSQPGFGSVVLKDTKGRSTVEVNVQPNFDRSPKPGSPPAAGYYSCATRSMAAGTTCTAVTLPDGTLVLTTDGPNDEPGNPHATERVVDTLSPNGLRVCVEEWNAVDVKRGTVTRPTPTLTLAQLQAIALNPAWAK